MIVGLGNPGPQYSGTRHNVGFELIDRLAEAHKIKMSERRHHALFGIGPIGGISVLLVKPMTFMNLSGRAVAEIRSKYGIPPERILVAADELDLPVGALRIRQSGGPAGHNGHRSLIQSLGTQEYPRIRIGVGKGADDTIDHVLGRFRPEERTTINSVLTNAAKAVERALDAGVAQAMTEFNGSY